MCQLSPKKWRDCFSYKEGDLSIEYFFPKFLKGFTMCRKANHNLSLNFPIIIASRSFSGFLLALQ